MLCKILEVRDHATFIPVLAIKMETDSALPSAEHQAQAYFLFQRCGYPVDSPSVMVTALSGERHASADPYHWGDRTWSVSHNYILEHFDTLKNGDVVDVAYILRETPTKKISERLSP